LTEYAKSLGARFNALYLEFLADGYSKKVAYKKAMEKALKEPTKA